MRLAINLKLSAIIVVVAVASAAGIHFLHEYQVRRSAGSLIRRADQAARDGDKAQELDLLKRYLAYRREDTEALQRFGLLLAGGTSPEERTAALDTLERVLIRDASRTEARRKAAELAFGLGRFDAARTHYEVLANLPVPDPVAEESVSRCEEQLKRYPEAVAWLEKAIGHDPSRVGAYAHLARLTRTQLKKVEAADRIMDAREVKEGLIAKNPRSGRAFLERASYRRDFGLPGADEDVKQALSLDPDDADTLLAAAQTSGREEAIKLLTRGISLHPDEPRLYRGLAMIEAGSGKPSEAIERLKEGLRRLPDDLDMHWLLAEIAIDLGRRDEAEAQIKWLRTSRFPAAPLDFLEERILVDTRSWSEAARRLTVTAPALELLQGAHELSKRAFLLLARCHAQLGNPDMRYLAARRAVAIESSDPAIGLSSRIELASALTASGRLDEASEEYRMALRLPGAPASLLIELGRVLAAKNLRLPPPQRRWDEVEQVLIQSESALKGSAELAILRAEVLAAQDRLDAAGERLRQAEIAHPEAVGPKVALATLAARQGRSGESLSILEEARRRLGDQPELIAALGRYWASKPGEASARVLGGLVEVAGRVADESIRRSLLENLAEGLDRLGDAEKSASIRSRLVAEQPDHLGLRLAQLDAVFRMGDLAEAERVLKDVRRIEGEEGSLWRYGRAQVLIRRWRKSPESKTPGESPILREARTLLAEAHDRRPGWSRAMLAAAEVDDMRGDSGSALRGYLSALENGERDPGAVRRAVQLLYRRGRFAQADALLRRAQQDGPLSPELVRLAADVALQTSDDDRAIDLARKAVAGSPDSAADQTWLGQLLFAASKKAEERGLPVDVRARRLEAEKALSRGAELAPADPDAQVALVLALAAWGKKAEAEAAIRRAESTLKGPAAELALARCLEAVGESSQAESKYRAILQSRPDDVAALQAASIAALRGGKTREAEPFLRRLINLGSRAPREAAWGRRVLALALSLEGQASSSKVRELLGLDDDTVPGTAPVEGKVDLSADDLRARAQVLARQPGRASRRKALAMIEGLIARDEARPGDLFLKAQLLSADGDWKRSLAATRQLIAEDPSNPAFLEFLARGQIASGNPDEASPWIAELARLRPQAPVVVELRAKALFAKGKAPEAVAQLEDLARKDPSRGLGVAGLLEQSKQLSAAEALLRGLEAQNLSPQVKVEVSLALAAFLGRRGRHDEAVRICEKLWADPKIPPSQVSSVALVALYTGHPEEAILRRVEKGIVDGLSRNPRDIVLRFDSANLAILRGRYTEAESMLRDLQKARPDLGAPLNNLAWLMALRGEGGSEPLDLIDRAIALDGPSPGLLDTRGLVLALNGQPDRALTDLEESIAADPSPTSYLHLALALRKAGKPAEAAEALGKARSTGLRSGDIHPLEMPAYQELVAAYPEK